MRRFLAVRGEVTMHRAELEAAGCGRHTLTPVIIHTVRRTELLLTCTTGWKLRDPAPKCRGFQQGSTRETGRRHILCKAWMKVCNDGLEPGGVLIRPFPREDTPWIFYLQLGEVDNIDILSLPPTWLWTHSWDHEDQSMIWYPTWYEDHWQLSNPPPQCPKGGERLINWMAFSCLNGW